MWAPSEAFEKFNFSQALQGVWQFISLVDGYLVEKAPWKLATDASKRPELAEVLYDAAEAVRVISDLGASSGARRDRGDLEASRTKRKHFGSGYSCVDVGWAQGREHV